MAEDKTSFATHLTHQFNLVDAQAQSGLYVIKRTSAYLRKIVTAQSECAVAIEKATKNEATKVPGLQKDGMASHVIAVCSLQDVFNGVINKYRDFGTKVTSDVIAPLQEFLKTGEKRRKDIVAKEVKATKSLRAQYDKLRKQRLVANATWLDVQATNKKLAQEGDLSAKGAKTAQQLKRLLDKGKKEFQLYEKYTMETFTMAKEYVDTTIPELLQQMEELEKDRLQLLKAQLALFAKLYNIWDSPTLPGNSYGETVGDLDAKQDVHKCIVSRVSEVGMPQGIWELPPALPCKSTDFDTEGWKTPVAPELPHYDMKSHGMGTIPASTSSQASTPVRAPSPDIHTSETQSTPPETKGEEGDEETSPLPSEDNPPPAEEQTSVGETEPEAPVQFARAVYDYVTDHSDDLQFKVGDIIRLISQNVEFATHDSNNPIWLLGELRDNPEKTGSFPSNYIEEYKP